MSIEGKHYLIAVKRLGYISHHSSHAKISREDLEAKIKAADIGTPIHVITGKVRGQTCMVQLVVEATAHPNWATGDISVRVE